MLYHGIEIDIQRKRVKNLRLTICANGTARLSVPWNCTESKAMEFVNAHLEWLQAHSEKRKKQWEREQHNSVIRGEEGEQINCLGKTYTLRIVANNGVPQIHTTDNEIILMSERPLISAQRIDLIRSWKIRMLKVLVEERISYWLKMMQEAPLAEVRFKSMTSRWGSCFPIRRVVCFNTRLVNMPRECVELVVVHELCHLKEASHNARFHALMARYLPDYRVRNARLKQRGME